MTRDRAILREAWALLLLAAPLVLAQLAQTGMGLVDTLMAGRLGGDALAGIALGATAFMFSLNLCMGVLFAVSPIVAQSAGASRPEDAGRATRQGIWLALALAVPIVTLFWNAEGLLLALGQPPEATALAAAYLRAAAWGFAPAVALTALRGLLEGIGDTRPIMLITFGGVALNVLANNALMFGRWGFPALGLVGTGYATTIVYTAMFVAAALYVAWRHARYAVFRRFRRPDPAMMGELLRIGVPIGLTLGFELSLFMITALLMGRFGELPLAAHQIAIQSATTTFMIPLGLAAATAVRVGQAVGRRDDEGARRAGWVGIGASVLVMFGSALLFSLAPRFVVSLFIDPDRSPALTALATSFLAAAAAFQLVDGLQVSAAGALRGFKDTRVPMVISFVSYALVGLGSGAALAFWVGIGPLGLWIGLVLGLAAAAAMMVARFRWRSSPRRSRPAARSGEVGYHGRQ